MTNSIPRQSRSPFRGDAESPWNFKIIERVVMSTKPWLPKRAGRARLGEWGWRRSAPSSAPTGSAGRGMRDKEG